MKPTINLPKFCLSKFVHARCQIFHVQLLYYMVLILTENLFLTIKYRSTTICAMLLYT